MNKNFLIFLFLFFYFFSYANGELAVYFSHLNNYSPHPPKSENHSLIEKYITSVLKKNGAKIEKQHFLYKNPYLGKILGTNIIATYKGKFEDKKIAFATHWDTRPVADSDFLSKNRAKPIVGANDGNSSTAILLALSDFLKRYKPKYTVQLLFFDAEDSGKDEDTFCIGSNYFVSHYSDINYRFGMVLDMVGDKDLNIFYEGYSYRYAKVICENIWNVANNKFKYDFFIKKKKYFLIDDHYAFLKKNIPVIDIIDFDYLYWHTLEDIPKNCSIDNMEKILKLMIYVVKFPEKIEKRRKYE